jgi:hypothetical protein
MKLKNFSQFNENLNDVNDMDIEHHDEQNYMVFENLKTIKRLVDVLLELDENKVDEIITRGHDWAADHISAAKVNVEQVFDFLINNTDYLENDDTIEGEEDYDYNKNNNEEDGNLEDGNFDEEENYEEE